jgi:hypothetical protein
LYALVKFRWKALPGLAVYTLTASQVSYLTWPYLWVYGLRGLFDSLLLFSDHNWKGTVLFEGIRFHEHALPRDYLPKLIAIQFTEPLVILALVGLISVLVLRKRKQDWTIRSILLVLWFVLPLSYVVIARPTLYNNFRQFLFITPPLFVFAGLGFQTLFQKIRANAVVVIAAGFILLPGILAIVQLHPLQYSYYNQFVGGVEGAEGQYELDFWGTGWAELAAFVSDNIPPGSSILVRRDEMFVNRYFSNQYVLGRYLDLPLEEFSNYQYAIVRFEDYRELEWLEAYPVIYELSIDNVAICQVVEINRGAE